MALDGCVAPGPRHAAPPSTPGTRTIRVLLPSRASGHAPFPCRGRFERVVAGGAKHLVNVLPLEDYLRGALSAEVPASWPPEALKAAAVVLRTYAVGRAKDRAAEAWDVYPDSRDQMYRGRRGEDKRTDRAIAETAGLVLKSGDVLVPGFHHSCCGGHTADSREVYGVSTVRLPVEGVPCTWCRGSKNWGPWTLTVSWSELNRRIGGLLDAGIVRDIEAGGTTNSGRVREVLVTAGGRPHRIDAARFRLAVGADRLRSTRFSVKRSRAGVTFSGTGWGHGVGLCQEGARAMAAAGKTWQEILAGYFPDARAVRL